MKCNLLTTVHSHQNGLYYPKKGTHKACKILRMDEDEQAVVRVEYDGNDKVAFFEETVPLSNLLLVSDYTSPVGEPKTTHTSDIPKISNTPPKGKKSLTGRLPRTTQITAIAVGHPDDVYPKMTELSSGVAGDPVTLAITHEANNENNMLQLRNFDSMDEIMENFKRQGSMDEAGQGRSCGVEAVCNAGFSVTARDFFEQAAEGVDANDFVVLDGDDEDDYLSNTGGGNNIPPHQMLLTMTRIANENGLQMHSSPHLVRDALGTSAFWQGHQWAIVLIPACDGHWVSMEKIIYKGQPAICLREGRGNTVYDFITSNDGECLPLVNMKRKFRGTGPPSTPAIAKRGLQGHHVSS